MREIADDRARNINVKGEKTNCQLFPHNVYVTFLSYEN